MSYIPEQPNTLSTTLLKKMVALLRDLGVPDHPVATRTVCDGMDTVRRLAVTLCSLHNVIHKKEKELSIARTNAINRPPPTAAPPVMSREPSSGLQIDSTSSSSSSSSSSSVPAVTVIKQEVQHDEHSVTSEAQADTTAVSAESDAGNGSIKRKAHEASIGVDTVNEGVADDGAAGKRVKRSGR